MDRGEVDANEAKEFFSRMGIKLSLTTAYNPEENGKVECGRGPIVKALVKACQGKVGEASTSVRFIGRQDDT